MIEYVAQIRIHHKTLHILNAIIGYMIDLITQLFNKRRTVAMIAVFKLKEPN